MRQRQKENFPQFYLIINARPVRIVVKLIFFVLMMLFFLVNLWNISYPENLEFSRVKWRLVADPTNPQLHLQLGEFYQKYGATKRAEAEFTKAINLARRQHPAEEKLLGQAVNLLEENRQGVKILENGLAFWQKIAMEKPDYRDAYIQIAAYAYQLKRTNEANAAIERALTLDPNFEGAKKLKDFIANQESRSKN